MSILLTVTLAVSAQPAGAQDHAAVAACVPVDCLERALRPARRRDVAVGSSAEARDRARRLFAQSFAAPDPATLAEAWRREGFELVQLDGVWLLREVEGARSGRGVYAWRTGEAPAWLVTAPHGLPSDDRLTAELATRLFVDRSLQAAAWSTVPRTDLDLTHTEESYFQEYTAAFAAAYPDAMVAQLHGFAQSKRRTDLGRSAEIILSNGTREPDRALRARAACLQRAIPAVAVFPDVPELGATTNAQARMLRSVGQATFLHIEMSYPTRRRLLDDADLFALWTDCLVGAEE